ncbi:MAG: ATP-binding protein [bacterium]
METSYLYFVFSAVFNTVVSTILGIIVFVRDRKNKSNRAFALFCLGVALWSAAYILWPLAKTKETTLLSFQLLHIPACFVSIFYLHFVVNWLGIFKKNRLIIIVGYILSTYFACFTFSPAFIRNMAPLFSMRYWAEPGMLYHFYLLMFFGLFFYSSYLLVRYYGKSSDIKRAQIKFILIGMALSFAGGSTNYFLWYNINVPPYGNIVASSFVIFTAYAIVKYNLLNVKVAATEGALLLMNLLLFFRSLVSTTKGELAINGTVLLGSLLLSVLLIKSVKKEIKRREEVTNLAHSLERANLKLKELDRQKTEFLSIASHQLRTPLSIIKGYIELIQDGVYGKISKSLKQILVNMDVSNEHLAQLVDNFLDISRIEQRRTRFDFKAVDLEKIVSGVVNELKDRAISKGLKLEWKFSKKSFRKIWADDEKIRHVVFNFVDNAIKYAEKGVITITLNKENNGLVVRIKDMGIGFGKVDEANFFQKFYRGQNVSGINVTGTGLGLYVCRKFIESHKGKIWARSQGKNKGSEFGFWVPLKISKGIKEEKLYK